MFMVKLIFTGIKRRKKEIRYVSMVTFAAVLFLACITLFQSVMNQYMYQNNLNTYGNWIISSVGKRLNHPYFSMETSCKTGVSLIGEDGRENGIMVGTADASFDLIDGDNLYEGRMPEENNEIVMDTTSLAQLGYSYDVGQMISIQYQNTEGVLVTKEYQLVGVMKCFAQIWKEDTDGDHKLPNCFVTEEEFADYRAYSYITYFYQLDPAYEEIDTKEFSQAFTSQEGAITYNNYVYEYRLWGNTEVYEKVTLALMVMSVLAITYLMMAYTGKRRGIYYKYRCIGASKAQVRGIIFMECIYATFPEIILGIAIAYGTTGIACKIAGNHTGVTGFYQFDGELLVTQIAVLVGVILTAVAVTQFGIRDKGLAGNKGTIKPSKYKKLRRVSRKTKAPEKTIFKRQNVIRPVQHMVAACFSMIVCGSLILCAYKIYDSYSTNGFVQRVKNDFEMTIEVDHQFPYIDTTYNEVSTLTNYDMFTGENENLIEMIEMCPGIKDVEYLIKDGLHYFEWDGMEESQIIQSIEAYIDTPLVYEMRMVFYENLADVKKQEEAWSSEQGLDWEKFEAGEQVIITINGSLDETLQAGDWITIKNAFTEKGISVEVAGVYDWTNENILWADFAGNTYLMIGSKALAEKIAANEGEELQYNTIRVTYDQNASYESSDKQLARIAKDNGYRYSSEAELRRLIARQLVQDVGVYGTLFVMILTIYVVIQRSFLVSKNKYWQTRFILLKQIGMEDRQYFKMALWEECKSYLWIFIGLIPGYMASAYAWYAVYGPESLGEETNLIEEILFSLTNEMAHGVYILIAGLLYIGMIFSSACVINRCIKGGMEK